MNEHPTLEAPSQHLIAETPPPSVEALAEPVVEPAPEAVAVEAIAAEPAAPVAVEPPAAEAVAAEPAAPVAVEPPSAAAIAAEPAAAVAAEPAAPKGPTPEQLAARQRAQERWERLVAAHTNGESREARVKSLVKGGLLLDIDGYRAFLPASQSGEQRGAALDPLVGTTVQVKVIDVDETRKRLVVSRRRALAQERRESRSATIASLEVGKECDATVVRLTDFGAFVDLGGGVDALVPMSELDFERVAKASDVVSVGERLRVRILRVEGNGKKIAASRKAMLADPWRDNAALLRNGATVEGTVVALEPRLAVEVAPGIVGTISDREADPADYAIGEKVEVTIRSLDMRARRLRLSVLHGTPAMTSTGFAPLGQELRR